MYIPINHTIENPCLIDINKICKEFITNRNRKNDLFSIKNYFELIFNHNQTTDTYFISTPSFLSKITNIFHFLEPEFFGNDLRINLENSLHHYIENF